jgi:2-methylcitrate dehydratase PrpD
MHSAEHRTALLDWLGCAVGGRDHRAARAARMLGDGLFERIAAAGTAGHVLDYDDTYLPGLAHLSAPVAPVALLLGAERGATIGEALDAFADGFEFAGRLTAANHPELRAPGWHPTAVAGAPAAALAAARLLGLDEERTAHALRFALLQAAGLRAAFGSDGKSVQVGRAAAAGAAAARLAEAGALASADVERGEAGFEDAYRARWVEPGSNDPPAVSENWIKAYPCCLQTHGAIECAERVGSPPEGALTVLAHPVSRQAAGYDAVETSLQAKFSIPYTTAFTLLHGGPKVDDFAALDPEAQALAARITVRTDLALGESEFALLAGDEELARVDAARGSPLHPLSEEDLRAKVHDLAGDRFDELPASAGELLTRL